MDAGTKPFAGGATMTAHKLAHELLKQPDLPVLTEGCDCFGRAAHVGNGKRVDGPEHFVYIYRNAD